jgi:hypothetical protein
LFFVKTGATPRKVPFLLFSFSFSLAGERKRELKKNKKNWVQRKTAQEKKRTKNGPKTGKEKKRKKTTRNKSVNRTILFHFSCSALVNAELLLIYPTDARNAQARKVACRRCS